MPNMGLFGDSEDTSAVALANFLDISVDDVEETGDNTFNADGDEYLVFDNYDSAYDYAVEDVKNLLEIEGVQFIDWDNLGGIHRYVDTDYFNDMMNESHVAYAQDIENESSSSDEYENRLQEECADYGIDIEGKDSWELADELAEQLDNNYSDGVEWYIDNFGEDDLNSFIKEHDNLIDLNEVATDVVDNDGVGSVLARYDGKENEYEGYYIYRTN